jgi:hypothetical protein
MISKMGERKKEIRCFVNLSGRRAYSKIICSKKRIHVQMDYVENRVSGNGDGPQEEESGVGPFELERSDLFLGPLLDSTLRSVHIPA